MRRRSILAYSVPGLGRFRCNVFQQRGTVGLVLRVIPMQIRSIDELALPPVLKKIASEERGLVLVTGTTGSGKSTTLAALIDHINQTRCAHVMTVEDPIEFLHRDQESIINQREVSVDTRSFAQALRSALRQDPGRHPCRRDVRALRNDRNGPSLPPKTGHLVFSTLHTLDATETINRIIAVFPPHQQKQVRLQLASVLKAVISQRLMPTVNGVGRAAAVEVMIGTAFIRDCIVDKDKTHLIPGAIAAQRLPIRHAEVVRSIHLRPVPEWHRLVRRSAALGHQRRRIQAQGSGHLDQHGTRSHAAAGEERRHARDHALRKLIGLRASGCGKVVPVGNQLLGVAERLDHAL